MDEMPTKVYIKTDANNSITAINSSIFLSDPTGWIEVDEGHGDRYAHAQGNYLPGPVFDENGIPRYKWEGSQIMERTPEEMAEDLAALLPGLSEAEMLKIRLKATEDAVIYLMDLQMTGGMM